MSEASWMQAFDQAFYGAFAAVVGTLDATYTPPPGGPGSAVTVQVLKDVNVEQFGEDGAPIAFHAVVLTFRRQQVEPATRATVTVGGQTYNLAQHIGGDDSLSRWSVRA